MGGVAAWALLELRDTRKSFQKFVEAREEKIVEAYLANATAMTRLQESIERRIERESELVEVLRTMAAKQ
jgi:hypothetical protein